MIFKPELVKKINAGTKTMTRRIVKDGETECRYREGRVYAVQPGRGKAASFSITILDIRQERLGEIDYRDARREGFKTTDEFAAYWTALHKSFRPDQLVWVIGFIKGDLTDTPHLLAARPGGAQGDYTSIPARAVKGEGEAVQAKLLDRWAVEGRERHADVLAEQRKSLLSAVQGVRIEAARRGNYPRAQRRLKSVEHHLKALENEARGVA